MSSKSILDFKSDKKINSLNTIKRWSLENPIKSENLSQHSFWVSLYAMLLAESFECLDFRVLYVVGKMSLLHDTDEIFTGDLDHNFKNDLPEIKEMLDNYVGKKQEIYYSEYNQQIKNFLLDTPLSSERSLVKKIIKVSDWLSFLQFCENEISLGNTNFLKVRVYCEKGLLKATMECKSEIVSRFNKPNTILLDDILDTL